MFRAIAFFRLRRSTKRQKTLFRTFVSRRNGKKLFFGPSSVDKTAKNSFLRLRQSTKRQKTLFCAFVGRRSGKKHFSKPSSVDETGRSGRRPGIFTGQQKRRPGHGAGKRSGNRRPSLFIHAPPPLGRKRPLPDIHPILRRHKHRIALLNIKCLIEGLDITQSRVYTPFAQ